MRGYIAITPSELEKFLNDGSFHALTAVIVEPASPEDSLATSDDQEELEFESSWSATQQSRDRQVSSGALGLALAVDLNQEQLGEIVGNQVGLLSNILWPQVQSLLLSESDEPELSWFAAQEIPTYLPQWLA